MPDSNIKRTEKERVRHAMRARRRALSREEVSIRSAKILEQIEALPEFREAACVALYLPFDNEVDTLPLFQKYRRSKRIVATRITLDNLLELREIRSEEDLEKGRFGVREARESCPHVPGEAVDLFLVPGIAFDESGHRLGFGAGHFDRLLSTVSAYRVGLAYAFQRVESLPYEAHDIPMHRVLSETLKSDANP